MRETGWHLVLVRLQQDLVFARAIESFPIKIVFAVPVLVEYDVPAIRGPHRVVIRALLGKRKAGAHTAPEFQQPQVSRSQAPNDGPGCVWSERKRDVLARLSHRV